MITLSIPPLFDDTGYLQLDAYVATRTESHLVIAAQSNTWASASALVGLRSLVDELHADGRFVSIELPLASPAALRFVSSGLCVGLPAHREVGSFSIATSGWSGVPIAHLYSSGDAARFASEVFVAAQPAGPEVARLLATTAGELAENSVTHSGTGSAVAIVEFGDDGYELAVVDRGKGIQFTWSARFPVSTDSDALLAATSRGGAAGQVGMGLPWVAGRTASTDVEFVLRSGYGGLRIRNPHASLEELSHQLPGAFAIFRQRTTAAA